MATLDVDSVPASLSRPSTRAASAHRDGAEASRRGFWQRRYGIPAPGVWPVAESFIVSLAVSASLTADGTPHPHLGLIVLTVGAAVCAWGGSAAQVLAITGVTWLFDNGFGSGQLGDLHWRGDADVRALALLLAGACAGAAASRFTGSHRQEAVKKGRGSAKASSRTG